MPGMEELDTKLPASVEPRTARSLSAWWRAVDEWMHQQTTKAELVTDSSGSGQVFIAGRRAC